MTASYDLSPQDRAEIRAAVAELIRTRGPLPPEALDEIAAILAAYREERRRLSARRVRPVSTRVGGVER